MLARIAIVIGSLLAAAAVGLGAFGAHGLEGWLDAHPLEAPTPSGDSPARPPLTVAARMANYDVAVRYQMYHALALVLVGAIAARSAQPHWALGLTTGTFVLGVALFSGLLLAIVFTGVRWLGALVPLGGLSFIVGWLALAHAAWWQRG